jgi:hypothetical protein
MSSKDIPLNAFVRRIAREAEKNFDRHGEIPMVWFFDIPGEGLCVMITPVDPNTRNQLADRMRSLFWEKRVTRYAMVAEAWAATTPGWTGPAVNDPQRVESVVIYAEDAREAISAKGDIIRPEHGKPYLTKLDVYHGASRGRFANLLAPTKGGPAPRMPDELKVKIKEWAREHGDRFYIGSVIERVGDCPDGGAAYKIDATRAFGDHQSAIDGAADALGEELVWTRAGWTAIGAESRRTWVIARIEASTLSMSLGYIAEARTH